MKRLAYIFSLIAILASCSREEEPQQQPVKVTASELIGTWIHEDKEQDKIEIIKFTEDRSFYQTDDIANAEFTQGEAGYYSIVSDIASLTTTIGDTKKSYYVTELKANTFTVQDRTSGATITYARLAQVISISYDETLLPDYNQWIEGRIKSYNSHNSKIASVNSLGAITGKSQGLTLIDIETSEGMAKLLVKVEGLIYDYSRAIGLTKDEVLAQFGTEKATATNEVIQYVYEDKLINFKINKRSKLVDAIYITYLKKNFTNKELATYLQNKYYAYKPETATNYFVFTDKPTYEESTVKVSFDNSINLSYQYINHDLFEDFSIALNKQREEIVYMYGDELTKIIDLTSIIEFEVDDEILGYPGAAIMDEVKFTFDNNITVMVDLHLAPEVKDEEVTDFLSTKYTKKRTSGKHVYFLKESANVTIDYNTEDNVVRYYSNEE